MIDQILDAVGQVWPVLGIEQPMPNHIHYVLQSRRRVVFFLFAPASARYPLVVAKVCRDPAQNRELEQSVVRAQQIRLLLDPAMQTTVPNMGLLRPINGLAGVAERALPGQPLEVAAASRSRGTVLASGCRAFADWLVRFQACTRSGWLEIDQDVLESLLLHPLAGLTGIDDTHRSFVADMAQPLLGLRVPIVWAYGDAHPSNILLRAGTVSGVVDWEAAAPDRWPVFDWFQFALSWGQELVKSRYPSMDRLQREIAACELLMGQSRTQLAATLQQQTNRFLSAINLDPVLALPFFLVFLIGYYWSDDREALIPRVLALLGGRGRLQWGAGLP